VRGVGSSVESAQRCCAIGGAIGVLLLAVPAAAQERVGPTQEVWAGVTVTSSSWAVYSGITAALYGPLHADGWRVRAAGGYGQYSYRNLGTPIHGEVTFVDALVGYHQRWGALTVKGFAGLSAERHDLTPLDLDSDVVGSDLGAKIQLETWLELSPSGWASLDLSWASAHGGSYAARGRAGYRLWPELSVGLEAAAMGNAEYDGGRSGAFLRYAWPTGEISAAAGVSVDRSLETGGYGTLNVLYRY
jgi:hypothetical protein